MAADGISRESAVDRLRDRILDARARHLSLDIRGGNTKAFYAEAPRGEPLGLAELTGISSYEPSELVVTVRAGTPLAELESVLAEQGQCLAFEPPRFAAGGTVGAISGDVTDPAHRAALSAMTCSSASTDGSPSTSVTSAPAACAVRPSRRSAHGSGRPARRCARRVGRGQPTPDRLRVRPT